MEQQQNLCVDPNLNADAYRNLLHDQPSVDKQLEVVLVYQDESLLLGASNMVDRYWNGTLWFFSEPVSFDRDQYTAAVRTESGVSAATYLGKHDKFVAGEDSGLLQVFEVAFNSETQTKELQCMGYACQHDDKITSIANFDDNVHVVSAGMDCCIKIWDITEMLAMTSLTQAHSDTVTSVEVQIGSNSVFLSTSMDSETLLWDLRKLKPALGLWKKSDHGLTTASWKTNNENIVAIGANDGSIAILDIRNVGQPPLHESVQFSRGVQKLLFNSNIPDQLAGCCDSTDVIVLDTSKYSDLTSIFVNNSHTDFVRGLAWHKSDLITCSWDNTVLRHSVMSK